MTEETKRALIIHKDVLPGNYGAAMLLAKPGNVDLSIQVIPGGAGERGYEGIPDVPFVVGSRITDFDVIIVGCSTGFPSEDQVITLARNEEIPSIGICDFRGAYARHGGTEADHYLVPNLWAGVGLDEDKITYVGDVNAADLPAASPEARAKLREWAGEGEVVFWLASGEVETLNIILESLQPHQKLLCGLHPNPSKWPDTARIQEVLDVLGKDRATTVSRLVEKTDSLMALGTLTTEQVVVVATLTTAATAAAYEGFRVATADSPAMFEDYRTANPLATMADDMLIPEILGGPVIRKGQKQDLFTLKYPGAEEARTKLQPFDAQLAWETVLRLCK